MYNQKGNGDGDDRNNNDRENNYHLTKVKSTDTFSKSVAPKKQWLKRFFKTKQQNSPTVKNI
jgi:hypothetical protein